ncbi:MAG: ABC transporter permease [Erysipelotrichaceae bacterium]
MWHIFKYSLKQIVRNKSVMMFCTAFPLVVATLFNIAFGNMKDIKLEAAEVAIIKDENYQQIQGFDQMIETISTDKDKVINVTYVNNIQEATKLLEENKVCGIYQAKDNKIKTIVKDNGIEETILSYVIDSYYMNESVIQNLLNINPAEFKAEMIDNLNNSNKIRIEDKSQTNMDPTVVNFYSLIGMTCIMGGTIIVNIIGGILPNQSTKGCRNSITPINKTKVIVGTLLAEIVQQTAVILLLLVYLKYILNVSFGNNIGPIILLAITGVVAGTAVGTLVGVLVKKDSDTKTTIVSMTTMIFSFCAGMMLPNVKFIITENIPLLGYINPVNMITDGLYSLYYYGNYDKYIFNLISLVIFSIVLITISCIALRRQKYDCI